MKSTLEKRILLFSLAILTLTIGLNAAFNIGSFLAGYRGGLQLRSETLANGLKRSIENVLALGIALDEMEGLNARCQEIVANDPEIVYCLIEDARGLPLYSNDPSLRLGARAEVVEPLGTSTNLLSLPTLGRVYDVSVLLNDPGGHPVGRVRIGFPEAVLEERTASVFRRSLGVLAGAFLIVFAVVVYFLKRDLIGPIQRLRHVAREIASGNFRVEAPAVSTREFAELAQSLGEMAASLRQRDEKIRESYDELEETNRQLQESYEYQERISVELGRSREMYRSILETASDAIVVSDEEDRVVLINRAAEQFFGLSREEVERENFFTGLERLKAENIEAQYEMHQRVLGGEPVETEIRFLRPSDHRRLIGWVRASPVTGRDGRRLVQAIVRDVTREREIKENLEKSARELERLNQMKDSFLGVASHELKTPLTVIIGYSELILGEYRDRLDPGLANMMRHIADAGERLASIVRDMVDVSLLDKRNLPLKRREVDLKELVGKVARDVQGYLALRRQDLELDLTEDLPPLLCDPERILQALSNLLGNAIKFTPDGGCITLSARLVRSLRPPACRSGKAAAEVEPLDVIPHQYLEIVCADSGIGIAEADQVQIFEKFYEVGSIEEHFSGKVAFKGKGAGLGLTIVKGIVDMHGGEVWAESPGFDPENCPGSSFHILLPLFT